jgi:hypothetical protein
VNRAQTICCNGYSAASDLAIVFMTGISATAKHMNMIPRSVFCCTARETAKVGFFDNVGLHPQMGM